MKMPVSMLPPAVSGALKLLNAPVDICSDPVELGCIWPRIALGTVKEPCPAVV